jgi:predicted GIY-YIG superfamily endonuclease
MAIDSCKHNFQKLAQQVLPEYMNRLKDTNPIPATEFVGFKSASRAALGKLGRTEDFPGCYVFFNEEGPLYVGISRGVVKRLIQHLNYQTHNTASLVYLMASKKCQHNMNRNQAMRDEKFLQCFEEAQISLRKTNVRFVEIKNDLELYLFEVLAAMELGTCTWNTFRTH